MNETKRQEAPKKQDAGPPSGLHWKNKERKRTEKAAFIEQSLGKLKRSWRPKSTTER